MTTIETNGRQIVVVEVPEHSYEFSIDGYRKCVSASVGKEKNQHQDTDWFSEKFDTTGCVILGLLSELTAEQCEPYAPYLSKHEQIEHSSYPDYLFRHLLTSNNLDTTKPLLIIEKIK